MDAREKVTRNFAGRASQIFQESVRWAPDVIRSHLIQYLIDVENSKTGLRHHTGLALATESVLKHCGLNRDVKPLGDIALSKRPECVKVDSAVIISAINLRSRYAGQVSGMRKTFQQLRLVTTGDPKEADADDAYADHLGQLLHSQSREESEENCGDTLFQITALLIQLPRCQPALLHNLAWAPLSLFTVQMLETAVACWEWLLAARPDMEIQFIRENAAAFLMTKHKKMGLFSPSEDMIDPLMYPTGSIPGPPKLEVKPHNLWTRFLLERVEVAKYCSPDQVEILVNLLCECLSLEIGGKERTCSRHVDALGPRFRLLLMGLSILQCDSFQLSLTKGILRERVYATCFDFFCVPGQHHATKASGDLRDDIQLLIRFWNSMHSEKKYLKNAAQRDSPEYASYSMNVLKSPSDGGAQAGDFDAKSMISETQQPPPSQRGAPTQGAWINTMSSTGGASVSGMSRRSVPSARGKGKANDYFYRDYVKRRNLILALVTHEVERLMAWIDPTNSPDQRVVGEDTLARWRTQSDITERLWRDYARLSWDISPALTVYLPARFTSAVALLKEVTRLVRVNPEAVSHIPVALKYLATPSVVKADAPELAHMLTWAPVSPPAALSFFSRQYPPHPLTAQYAVRVLRSYPPDILIFYVPQLVQALRFDDMGYMQEFLLWTAKKSSLIAHQLIWNMKTNIFSDEDGKIVDPVIGDLLDRLIENITGAFTPEAKDFYEREFEFFGKVTDISGTIKPYPKGPERKAACLDCLRQIEVLPGVYLPSNPEAIVIDIDKESGIPLQSAAKAPFLAKFKVQKCSVSKLEEMGLNGKHLKESEDDPDQVWQAAIFKVGDDVRQDMLALQVISLFQNVFQSVGLKLFLYPYRVVATAPGCGVIECIPNCKSRDQLGRQTDVGLPIYFKKSFGDESSVKYQEARKNFVLSMAAYSIISYLLQIKDRHNGNIMVSSQGHIIHIDFGFMFESSPGGNIGFEPDMKLSREMVDIMGGSEEAAPYKWFLELCVRGFLAVRPYSEAIITLVSLMLDTQLPCFRGQTLKLLRDRFKPDLSERAAADHMGKVVDRSLYSWRSTAYDQIQYMQNQIPYY